MRPSRPASRLVMVLALLLLIAGPASAGGPQSPLTFEAVDKLARRWQVLHLLPGISTAEQVERVLGRPDSTGPGQWGYTYADGSSTLIFFEDGRLTRALIAFKPPRSRAEIVGDLGDPARETDWFMLYVSRDGRYALTFFLGGAGVGLAIWAECEPIGGGRVCRTPERF